MDYLVSIDIRDSVIRLSQLTQDHYGYKVINMKDFSKNQLQNFMQQLYKTDEVGSDRIELDETTLTADSQDNFMEISEDNVNRPTLTVDVSAFGPAVSPPLSESSLINDDNNKLCLCLW